ncbi:hypothetical protein B7P34_25590 [Streptosporangium nondiastaticum]|uniref:Uncharacterized protein n=1 Tax=Streptosporangium nondiastaticum TaxID=35764 RepID=A0A9X7JLK8_9ACTN|nr:hypothetical protein B7P34_25590 [Streptosporangium nondiastaticum]
MDTAYSQAITRPQLRLLPPAGLCAKFSIIEPLALGGVVGSHDIRRSRGRCRASWFAAAQYWRAACDMMTQDSSGQPLLLRWARACLLDG